MSSRPADIDNLQSLKDVFFTPNRYRLDDRFVLRDGKIHPCAILCPGGGYGMVCSFIEGVPVVKKLNEQGISAFIVYYRVREKALYPRPMVDLARAVREVIAKAEQYHIDPKSYSVWGSSAGGHLAASFGTAHMGYQKYNLPKPQTLVLSYPVITMERGLTHMGSHDQLLGKDADAKREAFASIEKHISGSYPPTYLWCGDSDTVVPPENTKRMAAALEEAGVSFACDIFPGVDHGIGPGTGTAAEGWIDRAVSFWRRQEETFA